MKICFHRAAGLCAAAAILAVSCGKTQPDTPDPGTLSAPVLKIENVTETSALLSLVGEFPVTIQFILLNDNSGSETKRLNI